MNELIDITDKMKIRYTISKLKALIVILIICTFSSAEGLRERKDVLFISVSDTEKEKEVVISFCDSMYTLAVYIDDIIREKTVLSFNYNLIDIVEYDSAGNMIHDIKFNQSSNRIDISGIYLKTVNITDNMLPNNTSLFYIFEKKLTKKGMAFTLFDYKNNRNVRMNMRYLGLETIAIGDSKIKSHKYEMSLSGFLESTFWPYKYYYWYCSDKHEFKMYEGPDAAKRIARVRTGG